MDQIAYTPANNKKKDTAPNKLDDEAELPKFLFDLHTYIVAYIKTHAQTHSHVYMCTHNISKGFELVNKTR